VSERGSWMTQFMYRDEEERGRIRVALANAALNPESVMDVGGDNKILAGFYKLKPGYPGEEVVSFQHRVGPGLARELSKPLRVAVLCDAKNGGAIFRVHPSGEVETLCEIRGRIE